MNASRIPSLRAEPSDRDTLIPAVTLGDFIGDVYDKVRRRWRLMAVSVLVASFLGIAYALLATPVYTANGALLIDPRTGQSPEAQAQMSPALLMSDALTVDSELRVLTSREVTGSTVRALGLEPDAPDGPSLTQRLSTLLGLEEESAAAPLALEAEMARRAEAQRLGFMQGMSVTRAGDTFVIDVSYTSPDRAFAPEAVNTLMQEYLRLSGNQQTAMIERNRAWLETRITELGAELRAAETAVAEYRRTNDLLAPEGQPLATEVALNAAVAELVSLRSEALALQIQIEQIDEQIAAGAIDAIQVDPEARTASLDDFQTRYAELLQEEQELLLSWEPTASLVVNVRQQLSQTRDLIIAEYRLIRDRLAAAGDAMNRRVAATEAVIAQLNSEYGDDAQRAVDLRSLEREADAKRELYEQLLEEFQSASQLLTFDATSARVIAWAVPPDRKSAPRSRQIVVMAAFAGVVLAMTAIFLLDALDGTFRRQADLPRETGLPLLGSVPAFWSERVGGGLTGRLLGRAPARPGSELPATAGWLDFAARHPNSQSADTLRVIHAQLAARRTPRLNEGGMIVGFTSSVHGEGKTTTAANLANLLARREESVALVDLDLIRRQLSHLVGPILPATNTLSALSIEPEAAVNNLQPIDEFPGVTIIGNPSTEPPKSVTPRDAEVLRKMFDALRSRFDYVIVDLPPSQGTADTQVLTPLCDRLIYAVRWGHTPRAQVVSALRQRGLDRARVFGLLYTQAPLPQFRSYNRHTVNEYYA